MENSRLRLLQLLQQYGRATVDQLARNIGLASATVRRHLDILQRDRLVAFDQVKKKVGRPEYSFYLTESGHEVLPKAYDRLLAGVLHELDDLPEENVGAHVEENLSHDLLQRLAVSTAKRYQVNPSSRDLSQRIALAQEALEQESFAPEIERRDDSLHIRLCNCPFRSVALENPAVCAYDKALVSALLGSEVVQISCIRDGDVSCCYVAEMA